ncbi:PIG-L deacetylase family protein [Streptoalloteichus hindustanus]|uniref:N-acetylglucosaminyl deacetylase, LmbE family n=1 Tax=Streptoalloteichus hindustanus TaxID=2017 RepID=A0A1M4Z1S4_STRHI|nr:PIG-L family deacetylase [Streptoalloteichus hindustanus]SHF12019.1 N-acetylglucosaminyl deacetylase, LmbE family [Streptoalloteichus hindustanus]
MRLTLIAPHPDDIALSVGGWLNQVGPRLRAAGWWLDLVTVFTRSVYAPLAEADVRGEDAVSRLRLAEDLRFARYQELRYSALGLRDCSCLGMDDERELVAPTDTDPRRSTVDRWVAEAVTGSTVVVAPLAVGGHVDHRLVRHAVDNALGATPCLWYEDLPYALETTVPTPRSPADDRPLCPSLVDITPHLPAKRAGLTCYRSQMSDGDIEDILGYRPDGGGTATERLWSSPDLAPHLAHDLGLGEPAPSHPTPVDLEDK